jgi:hypothetical protein
MSLTPHARKFAFENRSYLGDFDAEFKKVVARESGTQGVLFDEKKSRRSRKSRDAVPLRPTVMHFLVALALPTFFVTMSL